MIIGFVGFISSGKNIAASCLIEQGFKLVSFASSLKDAVSVIFHWDRDLLEGITDESREWRETVDPWWEDKLGVPGLTPRWVLQNLGTDALRDNFHTDIWVASLERKLLDTTGDIVVSDCRFVNEIQMIRNIGGKVYRIQRGNDPVWFEAARSFNQGEHKNMQWAISKNILKKYDVHQSEIAWVGSALDGVITNNGTLDELKEKINGLVELERSSKEGVTS